MTDKEHNDIVLTFEEVVTSTGCEADWVVSLLEENVIAVASSTLAAQDELQFTGYTLARIRRAQRICRDFDASVPAVGLILELLDELEGYRKRFG